MNATQWKHAGYRVQFRGGWVYLYIRAGNTKGWAAWRTTVDGGDWMKRDSLFLWVNITDTPMLAECAKVAAACYCSSLPDSRCDFCSGLRVAEVA